MAFEARVSRWRTGLLVAGSIAFVVIGLWMIGALGHVRTRSEITLIGWVAILFFGLCAIGWGRQLFQSGVAMRIDANGIYWRRWSEQTIPWSAVERFQPAQQSGQRFMCLFLKDAAAFPATGILGRLSVLSKAMGFGDLALTMNGTDRSFSELRAAMDHFAPPV